MPDLDLISFADALEATATGKRHLLLGNGFSMALDAKKFSYQSLFEHADFASLSPHVREAFDALSTTDFERVMRRLHDAAKLIDVYQGADSELAASVRSDYAGLRDVLAKTLAGNHPERPGDVPLSAYRACREFLSKFASGKIFTLNYDLLLYWTRMQDDPKLPTVNLDDGFREDDPEDAWVVWDSTLAPSQTVYYLHGALHLVDAGHEVQKLTWSRTRLALVDQIRAAMDEDPPKFPLFVAEDSGENKRARIIHSGYLHKGFRSLNSVGGAIFTYGVSFGSSDDHIVDAIARGKVSDLWVGIHGGPGGAAHQRFTTLATEIQETRRDHHPKRPLRVHAFDTSTASPWGN